MTTQNIAELVERARAHAKLSGLGLDTKEIIHDLAGALAHMAAKNARLREALEPFSAKVAFLDNEPSSDRLKKLIEDEETVVEVSLRSCINARAALLT